jgi:uncharacterized protein YukE
MATPAPVAGAYAGGVMHIDPSALPGMIAKIQSTITTIEGDMTSLQGQIQSYLLADLKLPSTTPAIENAFTKYQANMKQMTDNLTTFSTLFQSVVNNLNQLDSSLAGSINKNG